MDNYTLKIDPSTRDLVLDDAGMMELVSGDATSAQAVRLTLEAWKGEFPFDPTHGTDYSRIAGKKARELLEDEVPEVIRDAVLQETAVSEVDSVEYSLTGRALNVSVTGTLTTGATIKTEVSTL